MARRKPDQEPAYRYLHGLIQCRCGGWHKIQSFWTGSPQHGYECHNTVVKCHGQVIHGIREGQVCATVIMCETCLKDDYCTIIGNLVDSDPSQTEMVQL